jgi:FlaA1/EpsC-like NDP-sugar epimerase
MSDYHMNRARAIALWLRLDEPLNKFDPFVWGFVLLVLVELYLVDAYHPDKQVAGLRTPARIFIGSIGIFTSALIYLFAAWGNHTVAGRGILLPSLGIFTIWAIISRLLAVKWMRSLSLQSRLLMLGAGESGIKFAQQLLELNPLGKLVVLAQTDQDTTDLAQMNLNCVGYTSDLSAWISQSWSAVIVANQIEFSETQLQQLMQIRLRGIPVYRLPDFYESLWYRTYAKYL